MHIATSLVAAALALPGAALGPVLVRPMTGAVAAEGSAAARDGTDAGRAETPKATDAKAAPAAAPAVPATTKQDGKPDKSAKKDGATRVEITSDDGRVLVGSLYVPKSAKDSVPGALLIHDADGDRSQLSEIADKLVKQGFAVLAIDLRGHGESASAELDWAKLDEKGARERTWSDSLKDVKAAAEFLRKQPAVHGSSLSLLGYRGGCTLAARHAVRDESVRSLVLLDPQPEQLGFNLMRDVEELGGLPTYVAVTKENQTNATRLVESGQRANNGVDFIQVSVFKGVAASPVEDKRMPSDVAKWMLEKATPTKGER